jgi:DNA-directed RNA polymerase subunit RPC12/RpoP
MKNVRCSKCGKEVPADQATVGIQDGKILCEACSKAINFAGQRNLTTAEGRPDPYAWGAKNSFPKPRNLQELMNEGECRYGTRERRNDYYDKKGDKNFDPSLSLSKCECGHAHDGDVCDDCQCRIFKTK